MKDKESKVIGWLLVFGLLPFGATWSGYVTHLLWLWFVVPLGAPSIGIVHAIGLSFLVGVLTHTGNEDSKKDPSELVAKMVMRPLAILGMGAIVHVFM